MSETKIKPPIETYKDEYVLKNLRGKDLFPLTRVVGEIGIGEFLKSDSFKGALTGESDEEVGSLILTEGARIVIQNLPHCEEAIYSFLSGVSNLDEEQIKNLPINVFAAMIVDVTKKTEFKDFFKQVSELIS